MAKFPTKAISVGELPVITGGQTTMNDKILIHQTDGIKAISKGEILGDNGGLIKPPVGIPESIINSLDNRKWISISNDKIDITEIINKRVCVQANTIDSSIIYIAVPTGFKEGWYYLDIFALNFNTQSNVKQFVLLCEESDASVDFMRPVPSFYSLTAGLVLFGWVYIKKYEAEGQDTYYIPFET